VICLFKKKCLCIHLCYFKEVLSLRTLGWMDDIYIIWYGKLDRTIDLCFDKDLLHTFIVQLLRQPYLDIILPMTYKYSSYLRTYIVTGQIISKIFCNISFFHYILIALFLFQLLLNVFQVNCNDVRSRSNRILH